MTHFVSLSNLFELDLNEGWNCRREGNVYTFINENDIQGVFQISAYFNSKHLEFDAAEQLRKEQKLYPAAEIVDISHYTGIHYGVEDLSDSTINYYWIIGHKNVKLFCSLVINSLQAEHKIDDTYKRIGTMMNSLVINSL